VSNSVQASSIRKGLVIMYEGNPHRVMDFQHRTPGNLRAFVQVKLRNLRSGLTKDTRFSSTETIEKADLEEHEMEFLYHESQGYVFMNIETYEQVNLEAEILGDAVNYMIPNLKLEVMFLDGNPISVELPSTVEMKVIETEPGIKSATVSNVTKPAKLETGVEIQVPAFINEGDVIRINPSEGKYLERVSK
jgi:elongation factor P